MKQGIENACKTVGNLSGVDIRQHPIKVNIDCLGDVILQEESQEVSQDAGSDDTVTSEYRIVTYLK
jgi:hypothetical protein